jgi:hypothetical protein
MSLTFTNQTRIIPVCWAVYTELVSSEMYKHLPLFCELVGFEVCISLS